MSAGMQKQQNKAGGFLNRDLIKYIAILCMVCNHAADMFLPEGTIIREILLDIGYFTAPTMCFFLFEGFYYTRDRRKYGKRLLIFALLSQVPYVLALQMPQLNIMFTLFACLLALTVLERYPAGSNRNLYLALLIVASFVMDSGIFAVILTILLVNYRGNRKQQMKIFGYLALIFALVHFPSVYSQFSIMPAVLFCVLNGAMVLLSGYTVLYLYNGKKANCGPTLQKANKWFFYLFYPGHLLILWLIRLILAG